MRLCKIKLVGFKSFVDPSTLVIPSNLVAIVGPNGCGKSNILDAITWVMGESSAKNLRGDYITDVIFKGTNDRAPVGQASVELIFDNSTRKIGGKYTSYNEISIKRKVDSNAVSSYFLNGTGCRRKDIQEIFLGTGLGNRSYAIIEQGAISRLIDAKPNELRIILEEAAGISKYKERRGETENRVRNTKENISRLSDIRNELNKQLINLQKQAKSTEEYQKLKKQEKELQIDLLVSNYKDMQVQTEINIEQVTKKDDFVTNQYTELRKIEKYIEDFKDRLVKKKEDLNTLQADLYTTYAEVSKFENNIEYAQKDIISIQDNIQQLQQETQEIQHSSQQKKGELDELMQTKNSLELELKNLKNINHQSSQDLNVAEQAMQPWQKKWDDFNKSTLEISQQQQSYTTHLDHLHRGIEESIQQRTILEREFAEIDLAELEKTLEKQILLVNEAEKKQQNYAAELVEKREILFNLQEKINTISMQRDESSLTQQKLEGQLSVLKTLQDSSMLEESENIKDFLTSMNLQDAPRLAEILEIENNWVHAVEIVLANKLQDIVVNIEEPYFMQLTSLEKADIGMLAIQKLGQTNKKTPPKHEYARLSEKISSDFPLPKLLENIYIADDVNTAKSIKENLQQHESVITCDGVWLGMGWSKVCRNIEDGKYNLSRKKEITLLQKDCQNTEKELQEINIDLEEEKSLYKTIEEERNNLELVIQNNQVQISQYQSKSLEYKAKKGYMEERITWIKEQLTKFNKQLENKEFEVQETNDKLENISSGFKKTEGKRQELLNLKGHHEEYLHKTRKIWQETNKQQNNIALQLNSVTSEFTSLEQIIQNNQQHINQQKERRQKIEETLIKTKKSQQKFHDALNLKLENKISAEKDLSDKKNNIRILENSLTESEQLKITLDKNIQKSRDELEQNRLKVQESKTRLQIAAEKIEEDGHNIESLITQFPENIDTVAWEKRLEDLAIKIQKIGHVNLAVFNELSELFKRKKYLDDQDADLVQALKTLEYAIQKIDQKSKSKFKKTFEQLNINLKKKFSKLFGGGNAYLELTSNDLLQTGVTIMARPPSKRNSTIQLLSGGEKVLTAVALVFSIFELNPAPFCILDEVDASLDDSNVARFSAMVKELSTDIQFLFITHNKITMEIADQLLGVTMQEAGVSHLVSVDLEGSMQEKVMQ